MSDFVAWDGQTYQGLPPAGWEQAIDGKWWPPNSLPAEVRRHQPPAPPSAAPQAQPAVHRATTNRDTTTPVLNRPRVLIGIALGLAVVLVGGSYINNGSADRGGSGGSDTFTAAAIDFRSLAASQVELCCEDTLSLTLGGDDEELSPEHAVALVALLDDMDFPRSVLSRMESTRALDGTQTAESDIAIAYWTYHPDDGLRVILEER